MELSQKLTNDIMREVAENLDKALDAEEYEYTVTLWVEVNHANIGVKVGGKE